MELRMNSPSLSKKLWDVLKIMIVMIRKGLVTKRKLLMGMNVTMKSRNLIRRTLWNAIRHESRKDIMACGDGGYGLREYEFSCENSLDPVEEEEKEVGDRDYGNRVVGHESSVVSVRTCDYSSEEGTNRGEVDYKAEEFIRRFHEQLRMQLLQYGS